VKNPIFLEERQEGTYINVFDSVTSRGPFKDQLQDDLEMAMRACEQDFGIGFDQWQKVADEKWH
jgi:hypothetical protein